MAIYTIFIKIHRKTVGYFGLDQDNVIQSCKIFTDGIDPIELFKH